jgi:membrane protein
VPTHTGADDRATGTRVSRTRLWAAALQGQPQRAIERAEAERRRHKSVDAVFEMVDRDGEVAGGIIAGALAYRFFVWLLPLALVAVAGLGIAADSASESPEETAESVGLGGLISGSISSAANSPNRWYALAVGIPVLVWVTRSLLRVLIGAHRLVWSDVRSAVPKPTIVATLRLLGLLLGVLVIAGLASAVREWSGGFGLLSTLLVALPLSALWLLVSIRLPHRDSDWTALVPGALLFGVGVELLQVVIAYVIEPWAINKQGTYGALGVAAALLLGLFLVSRLIVATAVLNVTLWERRARHS